MKIKVMRSLRLFTGYCFAFLAPVAAVAAADGHKYVALWLACAAVCLGLLRETAAIQIDFWTDDEKFTESPDG